MERANQILSSFLIHQRMKAKLKPTEVAQRLGCSVAQIEGWEVKPLKAPACAIARLVEMYKASEIDFSLTIFEIQQYLQIG